MADVEPCLRWSEIERAARKPEPGAGGKQIRTFTPAPENSASAAGMDVTEFEEIKLAQNFLLAAGLPNVHLIDTAKPAALANFTAVWRSDEAAGAVKIIYPGREVTGASIASDLISVDPKLCKGIFGVTRSSEGIDGAIVFRAALSCVDAKDDRTVQYFVTPRQRGGFVVFAVIRNNAAGGSTPNRLNPDLLGRAVLHAATPGG
jgi:hypothetical protein